MNANLITQSAKVKINYWGALSVTADNGDSLLPKGTKARALLALLATSDTLERSRSFLQEMLWSDRGREQRAASLRQCLAEMKSSFGIYANLIVADRQSIGLKPESIALDARTGNSPQNFLEGLSLRDPAFKTWLNNQRNQGQTSDDIGTTAKKPPQRPIVVICEHQDNPALHDTEEVLQLLVLNTLREICLVNSTTSKCATNDDCIVISIKATPMPRDQQVLGVIIRDNTAGTVIWSSEAQINPANRPLQNQLSLLELSNQTVNATTDEITQASILLQHDQDATLLALIAIRKIFSIQKEEVNDAIRLLNMAYEIEPRGIFQAWLAQAYTIQYIERFVTADADLKDRTAHSCLLALSTDSTNSNVLAAVANARTNIELDFQAGLSLSLQSVKISPANPLAWWSYSNALQCVGKSKMAFRASLNAQALGDKTRFKFWCDFQVSVTAAMLGQVKEALHFGETAASFAPAFRPPIRYLTALYAIDGQKDQVVKNVKKLQVLEPDFSIDRMLNDACYPIGIMRRYGAPLTDGLLSIDF